VEILWSNEPMRKDTGQAKDKKILKYITGELIIKQGDYGISIYRIVSGKVKIFRTYKGREVPLGIMEPGELFGEMAFLSKEMSVRSASAVALEDTELEIWHPRDLAAKYAQASPVLRIIMNQALNRLVKVHRLMDHLALKRREQKNQPKGREDPWSSTRMFYRKEIDIPCKYKPAWGTKGSLYPLKGRIKDISMGGICLEVVPEEESVTTYDVGDSFHIDTVLPNGENLNVTAEIVSVKKEPEKMRLGMKFKKLPDYYGAKKTLGFFLMPK
jgi:hypothetical protein